MPGSRKGVPNKRSQGVLALLRQEYDLDPILELAETIRREVPMVKDGEVIRDENGEPVMVPFLAPGERIQALKVLADKTYPALKAVDMNLNADLPTVVINLRGVEEDGKQLPPPKRSRAKKAAAT